MPPRTRSTPTRSSPPTNAVQTGSKARVRFLFGALLLITAIASTFLLSLQHLNAIALPGCGGESDCARAVRSAWATIPGIDAPVAFLALGFEVASLTLWLAMRGQFRGVARFWPWLGAIGSLLYIYVSFREHLLCPYCFIAHACNLAFLAVAELSSRKGAPTEKAPRPFARPLGLGLALAVLAVVPLLFAKQSVRSTQAQKLRESTNAIANASRATTQTSPTTPPTTTQSTQSQPTAPSHPPFTGRYRLGPESAMVRVVVFSDYQCPDCKRLEAEIVAKVRADSRFSVSMKQFPLSTVCNPHLDRDMHPDACWAARAAEVAGLMGGNDAFWAMSDWLFARNGGFDAATLRTALPLFNLEPERFISMLESPEISALISADIEEGMSLGIAGTQTPLIFINGVELRGWNIPGAFEQATRALLATNPPARTASADRPPLARERYLNEWSSGSIVTVPDEAFRFTVGTTPQQSSDTVRVVLFGDYLEPGTAEADRTLRQLAADPARRLQYSFQHFPFDQACNSGVPMTKHPNACAAARLAEAAGVVGGADVFWKAHGWLFEDQARTANLLTQGLVVSQLAAHLGVDAEALLDASLSAAVAETVRADIARAQAVGLTQLPWIVINGKVARQWKSGEENLLPMLVDAASGR